MKEAIFSYNKRDSLIHKIPAILKLVVLFCLPLALHLTILPYHLGFFMMAVILVFVAKLPLKSFLRDLKPMIYYCLFILVIDVLTILLFDKTPMPIDMDETAVSPSMSFWTILLEKGNFTLMSRLVVSMAYTSIFFRTTSHLEMRESLEKIESCITFGHSKLTFSKAFALFLNFLPQLFAIWNSLDLAWRARCGKRTIRKIIVLLPVFITLSLKTANQTLLSIKNRSL